MLECLPQSVEIPESYACHAHERGCCEPEDAEWHHDGAGNDHADRREHQMPQPSTQPFDHSLGCSCFGRV